MTEVGGRMSNELTSLPKVWRVGFWKKPLRFSKTRRFDPSHKSEKSLKHVVSGYHFFSPYIQLNSVSTSRLNQVRAYPYPKET